MKPYVLFFMLVANPAFADPPTIVSTSAARTRADGTFSVTLSHPDTGWNHYADGWRIETASGEVLGTRILHHPHVNEQPFTRSLSGVALPTTPGALYIRAKCSVDGWSSSRTPLSLN